MVRRFSAALTAALLVMIAAGTPAIADDPVGVGNPGQKSTYALFKRGNGMGVTIFEGSGPGLGLRVDISGVGRDITVSPQGQECIQSETLIQCAILHSLELSAGPGAGPGPSGNIVVRNDSSSATINVDVWTDTKSTLAATSPAVSGNIGDIVAIPLSVRNEGPNTLYRGGIAGITIEDNTELVSIDGCEPGPRECTRDYFRAGSSINITLRVRIKACDEPRNDGAYGLMSNPDVNFAMGRFKVKVNGCHIGTGTGQTSAGGNAAAAEQPTASPDHFLSPSAVSSPNSHSEASGPIAPAPRAAGTTSQATLWPVYLTAGTALVLLAAFGLFAYRRRKALAAAPIEAPQDPPPTA